MLLSTEPTLSGNRLQADYWHYKLNLWGELNVADDWIVDEMIIV